MYIPKMFLADLDLLLLGTFVQLEGKIFFVEKQLLLLGTSLCAAGGRRFPGKVNIFMNAGSLRCFSARLSRLLLLCSAFHLSIWSEV